MSQLSYRETVCFGGTNRHPKHVLLDTKVGTGLVFAKPTVIPTIVYNIQSLKHGWFSRNQPSDFLYEGWNTVDFPQTNRHSNHGYSCIMVGNQLVPG